MQAGELIVPLIAGGRTARDAVQMRSGGYIGQFGKDIDAKLDKLRRAGAGLFGADR